MAEEKPKSLAAKLAEIMAEVERIAKRGRNDFHKYDYATESDITAAIRSHLAERKIIILPRVKKWTTQEKTGEKGGVLAYVDMTFTILDGESGEAIDCDWLGVGEDRGDKAVYKGFTGALKYFLLKLFLIPTGDDPEKEGKRRDKQQAKRDERPPQQAALPTINGLAAEDIQAIHLAAKRAGYKTPGELAPVLMNGWGVSKASEVPRSELGAVLEALQNIEERQSA